AAFTSGYKYIVLEAPTGFDESPVAIAAALTLGSSYICTSTKDLQTQCARDFPFVRVAKGKNNFTCQRRLYLKQHLQVQVFRTMVTGACISWQRYNYMLSYVSRVWPMYV